MQRLILRWVINALALYVAILVLGDRIQGDKTQAVAYFALAIVFTLVNSLVRPILKILSCPLILLTLGLFTLVINGAVFALSLWVAQQFNIGFQLQGTGAENFWTVILGGLVVGLVNAALTLVLRDELKPS